MKPVSIEQLEQLNSDLGLYPGKHTDILDTINHLLPKPINESNTDVAIGVYLYALSQLPGSIRSRNRFCLGFGTGSRLSEMIEKGLGIDSYNPVDAANQTIYLAALYHHMKSLNITPYSTLDSNAALALTHVDEVKVLKHLETVLKSSIANSESEISELTQKRPDRKFLLENFAKLPARYMGKKGEAANEKIRTDMCNMLIAFEKECETRGVDQDKDKTRGYRLRYGALIYVMARIEAEYNLLPAQGGNLSAGSSLYKLCQDITHVHHTSKISPADKIKFFSTLYEFIPKYLLEEQMEELLKKIDKASEDNDVKPVNELIGLDGLKWHNEFENQKKFFQQMEAYLFYSQHAIYAALEKRDPHPYLKGIADVVNGTFAFGLTVGVSTAAGMFIPVPAGMKILQNAMGYVGEQQYGYFGRIAFEQLGAGIERGSISSLGGYLAGRAYRSISNLPGNAVYCILLPPACLVNKLSSMMAAAPKANPFEQQAYIDTLIKLPDSMIAAERKALLSEIQISQPVVINLRGVVDSMRQTARLYPEQDNSSVATPLLEGGTAAMIEEVMLSARPK